MVLLRLPTYFVSFTELFCFNFLDAYEVVQDELHEKKAEVLPQFSLSNFYEHACCP